MVRFASTIRVVSVISSSKHVGRHVVLLEHRPAARDETRLAQLLQRQVDRDAPGIGDALLPAAIVSADAVQHPFADVEDQVGLLGQRNELRRRDIAVAGRRQRSSASAPTMLPSRRSTLADRASTSSSRSSARRSLLLQHQPLDGRGVHLRRIEHEAVAAVLLRVIHRRVRVADQVDHVLRIFGQKAMPMLAVRNHLPAAARKTPCRLRRAPCRARFAAWAALVGAVRRQASMNDRELVTRQPADDGVLAAGRASVVRVSIFEHAVAGRVTEGVVDFLEMSMSSTAARRRVPPRAARAIACCSIAGTACGSASWSACRSARGSGCGARRACAR